MASLGAPIKFDDSRKAIYLIALARHGRAVAAASEAGVSYACTRDHIRDNEAFSELVAEAKLVYGEYLEEVAIRLATEGVRQMKFHQGEPIMVDGKHYFETQYDSKLLQFLILANMPKKYRSQLQMTVDDEASTLGLIITPAAIEDTEEWSRQHGPAARKQLAIDVKATERKDGEE